MKAIGLLLLLALSACGSVSRPGAQPGAPLSVPELQYRLIDGIGAPVFCNPRQYPVARTEDPAEVARTVADLRAQHPSEYDAIVHHEHLDPASLSASDNLRIVDQASELDAVPLTAQGVQYGFRYTVSGRPAARVSGTIDPDGTIHVASRTSAPPLMCPLCLAQWARIGTPAGEVPVTEIHAGTVVWTLDAGGRRVPAPVLLVGHTPAPIGHRVVHLVMMDGRSVDVSPGHPLPDGRRAGDLRPGDAMDGSAVVSAELVAYAGAATWDLLPAGATHAYWANGVPLGSTLTSSLRPSGQ